MPRSDKSPAFLPRVRVEVDLGALRRNVRAIRRRVGVRALFALKKDAYGHGAIPCARVLESERVDYFGVVTVSEGLELRKAGVRTPILVFGLPGADEAPEAIEAGLTLTIGDTQSLRAVAEAAAAQGRRVKIHLKVDTGMGRIGEPAEQQTETLRAIAQSPSVEFEGLYSHLACSDSDRDLTLRQASRFAALTDSLSPRPPICHLANSAGALLSECRFDMVRIGIGLFGAAPFYEDAEPVMTARSRLIQTRWFEPGATISYGATYSVPKRMRVGVVAAGYGDGLLRSLSNSGVVLIRGVRAPIVGRVCMDQFMVDLSAAPQAEAGDDALLFGRLNNCSLPAWEVAEAAGTISNELTTLVGRLATDRRWIDE